MNKTSCGKAITAIKLKFKSSIFIPTKTKCTCLLNDNRVQISRTPFKAKRMSQVPNAVPISKLKLAL